MIEDGTFSNPHSVEDFSEGFAICRDCGRPVCVRLPDGKVWRLYPSGNASMVVSDAPGSGAWARALGHKHRVLIAARAVVG